MTKVDVSDLIEFANELEAANVQREIGTAMTKALDVLENAIVQRTPVNTGMLRNAIGKEQRSVGNLLRGSVVNPLNYAWPVETGRKAGKWPPPGPIALYLARKEGLRGRQLAQATFLMRRAIGTSGTKAANMFADGFDASLPTIVRIFNQVPGNIMKGLS